MSQARFNDEIKTQGLRDILQGLKTMAFDSGLWAEGTNDSTIKTVTNTISYMIDGVLCTKAPTDNIAPTVCAIQAAATRCRYLITLDVSGNVTVTKGTQVGSLTTGALTTLAWNAIEKKLTSSANSLSSFKAKDLILVSGFTSLENNGVFTVEEVGPLGAWIKVRENGMVEEVAGDSVTVLRESPLPECPVKQCPSAILTITTVAGTFTVGTDDITTDAASATIAFTNIGAMPTEGITQ